MISSKHITKIVAVIMAIAFCLCLCAIAFSDQLVAALGDTGVTMEYESKLFDTNQVISVNIIMDDAQWAEMLNNAIAEEYYQCDVEINGETFYRVGIRPKGNTSLSAIASDPDNDRYSFKLEFDQYVEGQTCYGLDKLILNNNYADATNMKEALIYDMFQYLDVDASLYNYASISVNGEYWGVYVALEAVENSFLLRNYGTENSELYKPDSMDIGGGMGGGGGRGEMPEGFDPSQFDGKMPEGFDASGVGGMTPPIGDAPGDSDGASAGESNTSASTEGRPDIGNFDKSDIGGGFSMGGNGANLNYTDDDLDSYSTIWDCEVTSTSESDHKRVVTALKNISQGTDLEEYMDIDNLLKYAAVHVFSVNADSLSGTMAHNYYLYETGGQLNLLPWDYNLSLGGMGGMGNGGTGSGATSTVNSAIENAFNSTTFFDALLANEEYHAQYYAYLQRLIDEYLLGDGFEKFYNRTRAQIDELVKNDPNALYTYEEYETALETLCEVVKLRGQSIEGQLNGTIPSTESEQRSSDALIDASHLDLSVMGTMDMGGGFGNVRPNAAVGESPTEGETAQSDSATGTNSNTPPQFGGGMPEGFDPSQVQMPEGFDPSQGGQMPGDFNPSQGGQMPGGKQSSGGENRQPKTIVTYGICFALLLAALIFAMLYRRKSRRR